MVVAATVAITVLAGDATADDRRPPVRAATVVQSIPAGRIALRLPSGWRLLQGRLSEVLDPIPLMAAASTSLTLSRHECGCGFPNVRHYPRGSAMVFVWEYPGPDSRMLAQFPRRPAHFAVSTATAQRRPCQGPSDEISFRQGGRGFQVEIYFGPGARPQIRRQVEQLLDSFRIQA